MKTKKLPFKSGEKSINNAGYNGGPTVDKTGVLQVFPMAAPPSSLHESCNESIAAKLDNCHEKIPAKDKPIASTLAKCWQKTD